VLEGQAMSYFILFWKLLCGHALMDFALQTEWIAKYKNWHNASPPPPGQAQQTVWPYVLGAHALMHGMAVWLITGHVWMGVAESVVHFGIDAAKCANLTGIHQDQAMHVICKVLWVVFA
jgi:hypothetical protein